MALGCMEFLQTYMDSLSSSTSSSIFLSPVVLQASIRHYVQCVLVRTSGVFNRVNVDVLRTPHDSGAPHRPSKRKTNDEQMTLHSKATQTAIQVMDSSAMVPLFQGTKRQTNDLEVQAIAMAAARIKRAEILLQSMLPPPLHSASDRVQGLLLSVTDDFRALMMRCVACLYRLQGIGVMADDNKNPDTIRWAKDGLHVYSILAGRLGLFQLQKQIENAAFRVLYRRQYQAVTAFYTDVGPLMNTVASYLQVEAVQTLSKDEKLMALVEDLNVETRVKEPLSLWRKLIKKSRGRALVVGDRSRVPSAPVILDHDDSTDTQAFPPGIVSSGVFDFVALRVVVRARKWSENEDDELTREREKLLCYYIQNRLGAQWGASRVKDYIQFPKPNGYQSLHHTSGIALRGDIHIPFEVQIRSGEMHDAAEYGIASHWCYKLGNTTDRRTETKLLQPCSAEPEPAIFRDEEKKKASIDKACVRQTSRPNKSYLDALHLAKKREANVYVFMSSEDESSEYAGGLISLPNNARVRDALAVVKTTELTNGVGDKTIMRNGQKAGLNEPVANGDVLWLRAVK